MNGPKAELVAKIIIKAKKARIKITGINQYFFLTIRKIKSSFIQILF